MEGEVPAGVAAAHLSADVAQGRAVGLFGGERAGLETDDIALCQAIVSIPIDERFRSLNLAQAVVDQRLRMEDDGRRPAVVEDYE